MENSMTDCRPQVLIPLTSWATNIGLSKDTIKVEKGGLMHGQLSWEFSVLLKRNGYSLRVRAPNWR